MNLRKYPRTLLAQLLVVWLLAGPSGDGQVQAQVDGEASPTATPSTPRAEGAALDSPRRVPLPAPEIDADRLGVGSLSEFEYRLSMMVLVFGVVALIIEAILLSRGRKTPVSATDASRVIVITVIVTGTLFVVTAGFSAQAIAPALGLFGTVAGYLIGSGERRKYESSAGADGETQS